jgi:serine/threonine protein kinase
MAIEMTERPGWGFEEGAEIAAGRTVLRRLSGGGSHYEVYIVWDDQLVSIMVAKLLRPALIADQSAVEDLRQEAEMLDRLGHPVIVRGFDAVLEGPHPHLLIEHLEGPSLRRLIHKDGSLGLQQLLPLALHVAAAIQYMANQGVVHLDVKPDNIIMGVPPRLIDLSIARTLERAARLSGPAGTDAYMAPEQCDPGGELGERGPVGSPADVWGLGATIHHALTGSRPFPRPSGAGDSEDPLVRFPQLRDDPAPLPDYVPEELEGLLEGALIKDPGGRPTAAELAAGLEPLVDGLPLRIKPGRARLG